MTYENINEVLHFIQKTLKAPKNQHNKFGNYNYRNCEDIVEAVKAIMPPGVTLKLTDDVHFIGNRYYVKATASLCYMGQCESSTAWAREEESQKGMQAAQLTGSTSSYARKYALNGLFMIDDTKDADATNEHEKKQPEKPQANRDEIITLEAELSRSTSLEQVLEVKNKLTAAKERISVDDQKKLGALLMKKMNTYAQGPVQ